VGDEQEVDKDYVIQLVKQKRGLRNNMYLSRHRLIEKTKVI